MPQRGGGSCGGVHQVAQFHKEIGDGERREDDAHEVEHLRDGERDGRPARIDEFAEEGHGEDEDAHAHRNGVHGDAQQVEGLQDAEEHHKSAEGDGEHEERVDELRDGAVHGDADLHPAEFLGQHGDAHIHGEHAQKQRECPRDGAGQDERDKLSLDAFAVGLQREDGGGQRRDQRLKEQHIVGGEEVLRPEDAAERRQQDGEQRLHDIEGGRGLDVVDDPPAFVHDVGKVQEVVVHEDEVGDVARRLAPRGDGNGAVCLF